MAVNVSKTISSVGNHVVARYRTDNHEFDLMIPGGSLTQIPISVDHLTELGDVLKELVERVHEEV